MKMLSKILCIWNAILLTLISFCLMLYAANETIRGYMTGWVGTAVLSTRTGQLWTVFGAWLVFALAILYLVSVAKQRSVSKGIIKKNENGDYKISFSAIEDIANAEARRISGLRIIKTPVKKTIDGVSVRVKATVCMDESIPELADVVQARVRAAIEKATDIKVTNVKVQITEVFVPNKPRVE